MKVLKFFGACALFIGAVGGFGLAMYNKSYLIGVCVGVLAYAAWPTFKKWMDDLLA